ncbi:MAG: RNA polymerase factor sigma-54 [Chlamydiota bacterium]
MDMTKDFSLEIHQENQQAIKQYQRLMISPHMQQALNILQAPITELSAVLENAIEDNPILEHADNKEFDENSLESSGSKEPSPDKEVDFDEDDYQTIQSLSENFLDYMNESSGYTNQQPHADEKLRAFLESSLTSSSTLREHLLQQAHEVFDTPQEIEASKIIIGNLDKRGFLDSPLIEIALLNDIPEETLKAVLPIIKTFTPYGIGASNLQESLLIQLCCHHQQGSLAYKIIKNHYQEMLHNKLPAIAKKLKVSTPAVREAIDKVIAHLDLHPGLAYSSRPTPPLVADIEIHQNNGEFIITVNDEQLPTMRLQPQYLAMLKDKKVPNKIKSYINDKINAGRWLMKNVDQRQYTLHRIAEVLVTKQQPFFSSWRGMLNPLTMKAIAEELEIHESTVARAISGKHLHCFRGLLPLRSFFSCEYTNAKGLSIAASSVKDMVQTIVDTEDKSKPLSDQAISQKLQEEGISCARRTVTKYRYALNIPSTSQRKIY